MYTIKPAIKVWAEDDRPREKMILKGYKALSDSELIAILIGSGTKRKSAIDLAQELLEISGNNLSEFSKRSIKEFQKVKGIGKAKAVTIAAALELGRRRKEVMITHRRPRIKESRAVYEHLKPYFEDLTIEMFYVLLMSRGNMVMETICISQGGTSSTIVDGKVIYKRAIESGAHAIILSHNHPSGSLIPSEADRKLTKKLVEFGKLIELPVLDHLIFSDNGYYSFADDGQL